MSYDIQLDMEKLRALASDLALVLEEFDNANGHADAAAEATGHDKLAGKVRDFAGSWNIRRGKMIEDITNLQSVIQMVAENFEEADAELARALDEAAEDPASVKNIGHGSKAV